MGGEPWLLRKRYEEDAAKALLECHEEILKRTPDWPDVAIAGSAAAQGMPFPFCCLIPFSESELTQFFGTTRPQSSLSGTDFYGFDFWEDIGRGQGRYFVLYAGETPVEYCFLGYSFD
jgi:hypothetical protein